MKNSLKHKKRLKPWDTAGKSLFCLIILILLLAAVTPALAGQSQEREERVKWLSENIIPLRSIDPQDEDFSDLMPLVKVIGSARIVQLGENTHGDGAGFLAKSRLIRFLHQVMGFDVLAWEAGFFDCRMLDAAIRSDMSLPGVAHQALYRIWSDSTEVMTILDYARRTQTTPTPLIMTGFDCRVSSQEAREKGFPGFIFSFFDQLDPQLLSQKDREDFITMSIRLVPVDYYQYPEKRDFNPEVAQRLVTVLEQNKEKMLSYAGEREIEYVRQALQSFLNMGRALRESGTPPKENETGIRDRYTRDTAMAENILWLHHTYYPGRKMIVWAHNYHVAEDLWAFGVLPEVEERLRALKNNGPHGYLLNRALGDRVYTIGITGYQGSWGYVHEKPETLAAAEPGSLDDLLHQTGKAVLFLDMDKLAPSHWLMQPVTGRFSFWEPQKAVWPKLFDGILFIDTMSPAVPVSVPQGGKPSAGEK